MRVVILENEHHAMDHVAARIVEALADNPSIVLGLATGGTMEGVYARLVSAHRRGAASFARARSFNLDEYLGLAPTHPQSYRHFMGRHLFDHVDIDAMNTHLPDGMAADAGAAALAYEAEIAALGPIDLQLLGLGVNGHIGFNEPSSSLGSRTRIKTLTRETIDANGRFFEAGEPQPCQALTMGIATILDARTIVVLALGKDKAQAVAQTAEGPVGALWPSSVLQFHPDVTLVVDRAAAASLTMRDYYEWVSAHGG